jgi:poly [ADP-ribose] polymerase
MAHMIEVAKSGRAACRTCKNNIEKGELRFGEEFANQFSTSGEPSYRWHHLACAAKKLPVELKGALDAYAGEVPNRDELEQLMAGGLAKAAAKPAGYPFADHAPTNRARCMQCDQTIEKGAFRVAIEREIERGGMTQRSAGYMHPACVQAQIEDAGGDLEEMVSQLRTNSKLPAAELEQVIEAVETGGGAGAGAGADAG